MNLKVWLAPLLLCIYGMSSAQTTFFSFGSNWKYKDDGSNQGSAWQASGFNDSGWSSGAGQLGFGDGDETTVLTSGRIGYYFRKTVDIPDLSIFQNFILEMYRDDGVVIYINGVEVDRKNMPTGTINYNTLASTEISGANENTIVSTIAAASYFVSGINTIAVEVHQILLSSSDLSFDMKMTGVPIGLATITLGPYMQMATSTSMLMRWYTDVAVDSKVTYGTDPFNLSQSAELFPTTTNHSVQLSNLIPFTKYYYSIGTTTGIIQSGPDNYFVTSPLPNAKGKYTFWAIGDSGDGLPQGVRDRFLAYMGSNPTHGWLLLGDNAYQSGLVSEYTTKFFQIYQSTIMRKTPLWPATGNHEYENSARQRDHLIPYFDFFNLPTNGEAGGVPSGKEAYYSYDYGNIHFIALDSYIIENNQYRLSDLAGPQAQWLVQDLAANTKEWTIVYFHHPPFTMGSHNSDNETELRLIRENIVPILDQYDVDLVLSGHSHSYERSRLMKGHTGLESTFNSGLHNLSQSSGRYDGTANSCIYTKDSPVSLGGTVYTVVGSSGQRDWGQPSFPHNAMYFGNDADRGSLIIEIEENKLTGKWLSDNGTIDDQFTIMKNVNKVNTVNLNSGQSVTLDASWVGNYNWSTGQTSRSITFTPPSSGAYTVSDQNNCITDTYNITITGSTATIDIPSISFTETCAGSSENVAYTISGTFSSGNIFSLQLSNASGSFASPVSIGSVSSTAAGIINGTIPINTPGGNNYRVRVVSSNPVVTGSASSNFAVNTPLAPTVGTITQPTCGVATGSVILTGLPSGNWTINPGNITGSTTSRTITGLPAATYNFTVTSTGCTSSASANVVINVQPATPGVPTVGTITQPTCSVATGSVVLTGLPAGNWTINPGNITGSTASRMITGLTAATYNFAVTNAAGCTSGFTSDVLINAQPATPVAPSVGTITQPTCNVSTGSVVLNNLPSSGNWTLTRTPGGTTTVGSGTSTTVSGLGSGNYTFTVTNATGCTSSASGNVVINVQPATPGVPTVGAITQPTCSVATGSVVLSGLPSGNWTINPGNIAGSTASRTITGLAANTYNFTVTNAAGCTSGSTSNVVINAQPATPSAPSVGTITQPTCSVATGSVILNGLPSTGTWTLTRTPGGTTTGTGVSTTLSGLPTGTYTYTVTNEDGCISGPTGNIVINVQPIPSTPVVGIISQPTCTVSTGTVALSGLPAGAWTINPGAISGTGAATTIPGLTAATYNFTVTETSTGCTSSASGNVVINAQPSTPGVPTVGAITQPTCSVATGSVVLTGLPAGSWTINPGNITGSTASRVISGLAAATYNFIVTNAAGCTSGSTSDVVINAQPATPTTPSVGTITQPTCSVSTGSVVLSGLPSGSWTINPGNITGSTPSVTIPGLLASTYNFTVTNSLGCISLGSVNVVINFQPATPGAPTVGTITQPTCSVATGSVELTGLPAGSWTINPGNITGSTASRTITGLAAATYNFTVTNAGGCTSGSTSNVVFNAQPATPTAPSVGTITQPTCSVATGSVVLSGLPSGNWTINPGNITGSTPSVTIPGLPASTYNFTVTNSLGCISLTSANVVINAQPATSIAPSVGTITQPTCSVATGNVVLSGLPSGNWTINPGNITGSTPTVTIPGLPASTYNFTVTNSLGCISLASANVVINVQPTTPTAPSVGTIIQPTCSVATGSVVLSGLPSGNWTINPGNITGSTPATTIIGLTATTHTFTVTNSVGCTSLASANVVINAQPVTPTAPTVGSITQPTCAVATGSVVLTGLPSGTWTINPGNITGSTTSTTLSGLTASTYTYTVTNSLGCTSLASSNVVINAQPVTPSAPTVGTITQPTCAVATGSLILTGLPSGAWTINPGAISGSGTTFTMTGLSASTTYTYSVTNSSLCTSLTSANVVINAQPGTPAAPTVGSINQPTCAIATGSVELTGLPAGTWTINPGSISGSTSSTTIPGLSASTYNFTVTNSSGCTSLASANVLINVQPATPTTPSVGTITQSTCSVATGSVVLSGLPSGNWTINPGNITGSTATRMITGLAAATYNFTVTNFQGCVSLESTDVVIEAQPAVPVAPTVGVTFQPTCTVSTGTITVTAPAAGSGYEYSVGGTYQTTPSFAGLSSGPYNVTVRRVSDNTCISTSTPLTINIQPVIPPAPTVGLRTQPTCTEALGSVVLNNLPSIGSWTLTRSPGGNITAGSGTTIALSALATGTYTYTVTNESGCISSASSNVVINAQPVTPTVPVVGTIIQPTCTVASGSVALSGLPAVGTWTVTRTPGGVPSTGSGSSTILSGLSTGTYTFTVTSSLGCVSLPTSDVVINAQPAIPTAPIIGAITQPTCSVATGSVELDNLPTGAWTLTRSPGAIVSTGSGASVILTGLSAGSYTFTVTNTSTCTSIASASAIINVQPLTPTAPSIGIITQPSCTVATGNVVLNNLPPTGTWTLTRTPGGVTSSGTGTSTTLTGISTGTYTYTVTNASSCVSSASVNVVINPQPATPTVPDVGIITQPSCTIATGSVVLSNLPPSGSWILTRYPGGITTTGPGTSVTLSGLSIGTYTYTVTNASGCISSATSDIVINAQPPTPTVAPQSTSILTGGTFLVTPTGVPVGTTYIWTTPTYTGGVTGGSAQLTEVSSISGSLAIPTGTGSAIYTVTPKSGNCIGSAFTVTVTVTSTCLPVTIASQPTNTSICTTSGDASFTIIASGTSPFTYQWEYNNGGTWQNVANGTPAGALYANVTSATLNVAGISILGNRQYRCKVTNCSGATSVNSAGATLTVNSSASTPTIGIITQPTCSVPTGSVVLEGLPSGSWTLTREPGGNISTGTGTSTTLTGLTEGIYTYTVTNASGCVSPATTNVVINAQPSTPVALTIARVEQPTCALATGSIVLSNLPSSGTWIVTRTPGGNTTTGAGTSTTLSGLPAGTYTYTVTNTSGCVSPSSTNVVIIAQPATPTAPTIGIITQPTCSVASGSVVLGGLPSSGTWIVSRSPGGITTTGTGTSTTLTGLSTGTYTYTVINASGCTSIGSANVVINSQPPTPTAPTVGTITQPTCLLATGSVLLENLPPIGTWTLTRTPGGISTTGTGTSATLSGLLTGTYAYRITNTSTCVSITSASVVINTQPSTPSAPMVGIVTQPTCASATGSVVLNNLPAGSWTITRSPGGETTTGMGSTSTMSLLEAGSYSYTITNSQGCVSPLSANVVINSSIATPAAPSIDLVTQPTCASATGSVILSNLPASGTWTLIRTPGGIATMGTGSSTTLSGLSTGTYTFTVTNASGCISIASENVLIDESSAIPDQPVITDMFYCLNDPASALTATATTDHTLLWYGTDAIGGVASATAPTPSTNSAGTTSYYVSQRNNSTGCEGERATIIVAVLSVPIPIITSAGLEGEVQLNSSASGGNQWFKDGSAITGATSQTFTVLENGVYQVQVTEEVCLSELSEPISVIVTDVLDPEQSIQLNLFPIPASKAISLHLTGVNEEEMWEVMIFDISGKFIDKKKMSGQEAVLYIEEYDAGLYFIRISNPSFLLRSRFIKY